MRAVIQAAIGKAVPVLEEPNVELSAATTVPPSAPVVVWGRGRPPSRHQKSAGDAFSCCGIPAERGHVSRRLIGLEVPVFPDRRTIKIMDSVIEPEAGSPLPVVGALISVNREQLWIGSLQDTVEARLTLEEWDAAPPNGGDGWDEEAKAELYLRGQLTIDMGSAGRAVQGLRLVSGVGRYAARVYARNRKQVARLYHQLFDRYNDPLGDEFAHAKRGLEGIEQYLVQLWRDL